MSVSQKIGHFYNTFIYNLIKNKTNIKMKKLAIFALVAFTAYSCTSKNATTATNNDSHQFGVNFDSTANMDVIKSTFADMEAYDTLSYVKKYADTAVFIENGKKTNLAENVAIQRNLIAAGIKATINKDYAMWSSQFNFKDGTQSDFVYAYITVTFSKGDKKVDVVIFQADKFNKDGKIDKEYLVYDQSGLASLMK